MRSACVAFLVLVASADVAVAQSPATTQAGTTAGTVKSDPDKVTCRTFDTTGSRLSRKKICRTAAQWIEQNAIDRQDLDRQQANRWKNE